MDKRNLALICVAALTFWLFALAFGTANGYGLRARADAASQAAAAQVAEPEPLAAASPADAAAALPAADPLAADGAALPAAADGQPGLALNCRAAVLIDQGTGTVLYEMNADEQMPIASITKVMTLLLTFEAIHAGRIGYEDYVPISEHAYGMGGSQIWLEPGEQFTLEQLLKAICVSSANDAAVAVAEYVGGSEPVFVERMNARASELGMENTTFRNACGLDEAGHISTARDVALMSRAILNECPEVKNYTTIWMDTLRGGATQLINTNKLLKRYNGITGLKTGTTGGAGVCISASATREGLSLIAVVLGAPSSADRFNAATALLDYGFASYEAAALPDLSAAPLEIEVAGGEQAYIRLDYSALPPALLLKKGEGGALSAVVDLPEQAPAPVRKGDTLGTVTITSGERVLGEYAIAAAENDPRLEFSGAVWLLLRSLAGV